MVYLMLLRGLLLRLYFRFHTVPEVLVEMTAVFFETILLVRCIVVRDWINTLYQLILSLFLSFRNSVENAQHHLKDK